MKKGLIRLFFYPKKRYIKRDKCSKVTGSDSSHFHFFFFQHFIPLSPLCYISLFDRNLPLFLIFDSFKLSHYTAREIAENSSHFDDDEDFSSFFLLFRKIYIFMCPLLVRTFSPLLC